MNGRVGAVRLGLKYKTELNRQFPPTPKKILDPRDATRLFLSVTELFESLHTGNWQHTSSRHIPRLVPVAGIARSRMRTRTRTRGAPLNVNAFRAFLAAHVQEGRRGGAARGTALEPHVPRLATTLLGNTEVK